MGEYYKMNHRETACKDVTSIEFAQDKGKGKVVPVLN
jgi:hypothetical protein